MIVEMRTMRGFPDLASREPMKAKFYEDELWKNELEHVMMPMLDRYDGRRGR